MNTNPRAAVYARISEDPSGQSAGVNRQLRECRALAQARGWEVVAECTDNDVSALRGKHRPGYEEVLDLVRRGAIEYVVVWQTSRLLRNRRERAEAIELFGGARVGIITVKGQDLDLSNAYGRGMAGMLGEFDTMESEVKSERVAAAAADRARRGLPNGMLGYGWDKIDGEHRINAEQAAVIREVTDRLLAGETLHAVTADLNARKVPPPGKAKEWGRTSLRKVVLRPSNAALRIHHRDQPDEQITEGVWPAIVERDRWEQLSAKLRQNRRTDHGVPRPGARKHMLSYSPVGACGVCGSLLRSHRMWPKTKTQSVQYLYTCMEKACVGRSREKVDALVSEVIIARLSRPDARAWLAGDDERARAAGDRADALRAQLDDAADSYSDGKIDIAMLERVTERLKPQIARAEAERSRHLAALNPEFLEDIAGPEARSGWDRLTPTQRNALLEAVGLKVRIMPTKRGPTFRPEDVLIEWEQGDD